MRNVNQAAKDERKLYNINRGNNFHSFIKGRYRQYRGVATHYINRYDTLWAVAYRQPQEHLSTVC